MFYNILIQGSNLSLKLSGSEKLYGFYVNRAVEASNENDAKIIAMEQIQDAIKKKYQNVSIELVRLEVEEVTLLSAPIDLAEQQGFLLYLEEPDNKAPWWKFWTNK
jgi:hypothetical protein